MSDHILKMNQAKAGHTNNPGIKLKPVPGATKLILEGAKVAVASTDGNDKVRDTDREMDLTFYDANGNVETTDFDGDISMEDETTMQSVEKDEDISGFTNGTRGGSDGTQDDSSGTGSDVDESETDDELEQATQEAENKFSSIVDLTRQMYANNNGLLRLRVLKRLEKDKQELRRLLARLGIRTLRPVDIAWNYVTFYNEKIRQLWMDCNLTDPDERRHVMRQISALDKKRRQQLADADQLPDCQIRVWEFHGWVQAEYDEVCRAMEAEIIEKSKLVEQHEPAEQRVTLEKPATAITQHDSTTAGFLDDVGSGSAPLGDYDVPKVDGIPTSPFEAGGETNFDAAFSNATFSQEYDADRPGLDDFEMGLFALQTPIKPVEDTINDNDSLFGDGDDDSLFGDGDDYQLNPAPVSCQTANEAHVPVNPSSEKDSDGSLFGDFEEDQFLSSVVPSPHVENARNPENASHASPVTEQASSTEATELNESDSDDSLFGDFDHSEPAPALVPSQAVQEARGPENASHASLITSQCSIVEDPIGTNESGPLSNVPVENHLAEPAAAADQAAERLLIHDDNAVADTSVDQQVSQDQQGMELQQMADHSVVANNQAGPPPYVPGVVPAAGPNIKYYPDILVELADRQDHLDYMREVARGYLCRFWPDGKQDCSLMQLDLFALATDEFKDDEFRRYELCHEAGKPYLVHFQEEFKEIPPNMTLAPIYNGSFIYRCLAQNTPVAEPESESGFIDLTGDNSTSCTIVAHPEEPEPALAAPAEIFAASEPRCPAAGGKVVPKGRKISKKAKKAPQKVETIQTPSPVGQATFTQDPAQTLTSPLDPTTPANNGAIGNNDNWSSEWSGKTFSDGGEPPRTPSDTEVVVMQRSVSDDNDTRKTSPNDEAVGTKRSGTKARTESGSGSVRSVQRTHTALQNHLSQSGQVAGNINTPPSANHSPVEGRQQSGTPEQQQLMVYYSPSPKHRADPKKWVEEHIQGGKGKKTRKRKTPEPKETSTPRKARKTKEATATPSVTPSPRPYVNIAPAPARNHGDADNMQMQSRMSTSMDRDGRACSSSDVQPTGFGTPMHTAMAQVSQVPQQPMHQRVPQQQNAQQHQYTQPPVGPQNFWTNHVQQQHTLQAGGESLEEAEARLKEELRNIHLQQRMAQKHRQIANPPQQEQITEPPNMMSNHSAPQGTGQHLQQGGWQQGGWQQGNVQPTPQGSWPPPPQGAVPASNDEIFEQFMQFKQFQQFHQWILQEGPGVPNQGMAPNGMAPNGMAPNGMAPNGMAPNGMVPNGMAPNGMAPNGMAPNGMGPNGMAPNGMAPNGVAPRPDNQHGHHWRATPGQPMANGALQNGNPASGSFNQTVHGANGYGYTGY
ncbi:hypothetical protein KVR01_009723 [Diaporthe batatas]|uniref:uncharacterized protein n=1 Tax=Diaporthe batatas TaxID=748121 RepID=UPI001D054C69|nr:uncharacterized protein KVR01_009723 [Diaporthe batatas]KAG8160187.1 hypothetical protein KVR01_009723 [Diaporthe batatas]